ncbi:MAG: SDR family oxidoreductase [Ruminococcaceae bacterium]|nr:SDR family oxidoreductase [Oscillospiraceae bacterium]
MNMFSLEGKVAVVTGAGGVLCAEISKGLAKAGATVALLDLRLDMAEKAAEAIRAEGGNAAAFECNVLERASIEKAKDAVMAKFGRVDILLNGAGGNHPKGSTSDEMSFFDIPQDAVQWVFNLNILGTIMPTQVFGKLFAEQDSGCVVNISSMSAYHPLTRTVAYSAAKAGVTNFTEWMAVHFNQEYSKNIRVNAIAPGFLLTQQNYYLMVDEKTGGNTPRAEKVLGKTPMDRFGEPSELVGGVIFLCSDAAKFVNGVVLPIDGGFNAYSGV